MKKLPLKLFGFILLALAAYLALSTQIPSDSQTAYGPLNLSLSNAQAHVERLASEPHAVGFPAHATTREYILQELRSLGLEPLLQEGYTAGDWANLSRAINIMARIEGSNEEAKALVLMSHYDSQPHSSYGASDAASGVATILEGVRAMIAQGIKPANDIILLFTDAEELGLNGADLFVNQHPWAREAGLVLNFEARGSGGPSYFLLETNSGNAELVTALSNARLRYPVGNSLAYSIYKLLPNDTDLTVFREDKDIQGINFAFIDDHYDYHTALDMPDRLDPETLAHQLEYLSVLLPYFSEVPLELKDSENYAYFNVPFFGLITYPYQWNWILWSLAFLLAVVFSVQAFKKRKADPGDVGRGFLLMLLVILGCGLLGYYLFPVLKWAYPQYAEMLHGFTYNGHWYILSAIAFSFALAFAIYGCFKSKHPESYLIAPVLLWLSACAFLNVYLPGASFFIIPVIGLLCGALILVESSKPRPLVLAMLGIPATWILFPMLQMFPVGLGLSMLITATLLSALLYFCLLPFFLISGLQKKLSLISLIIGFLALIGAHFQSGNTPDAPLPSSLIYMLDSDTDEASWATTEKEPSAWTRKKIPAEVGPSKTAPSTTVFSSKYNTRFRHFYPAPPVQVPAPMVEVLQDTLIDGKRQLRLQIRPQRDINRLEVFTNPVSIEAAVINGINLSPGFLAQRGSRLFTHYVSNNDPTLLDLTIPAGEAIELDIYESSNNLLDFPGLDVEPRPENQIPTPFVLNDAVIVKKTLRYE